MRIRKKPWMENYLTLETHFTINSALTKPIQNLNLLFDNQNPYFLEIGIGKGNFILNNAKKYPNNNYLGFELSNDIFAVAYRKLLEYEEKTKIEINNLKIININANKINTLFKSHFANTIYLNFSDPWPKTRHQKRRLTSKSFLDIYQNLLIKDGELIIKTDNKLLYNFSLESLKINNWKILNFTLDLHNSKFNKNNIMTEYEEKFVKKQKKIFYIKAKVI